MHLAPRDTTVARPDIVHRTIICPTKTLTTRLTPTATTRVGRTTTVTERHDRPVHSLLLHSCSSCLFFSFHLPASLHVVLFFNKIIPLFYYQLCTFPQYPLLCFPSFSVLQQWGVVFFIVHHLCVHLIARGSLTQGWPPLRRVYLLRVLTFRIVSATISLSPDSVSTPDLDVVLWLKVCIGKTRFTRTNHRTHKKATTSCFP